MLKKNLLFYFYLVRTSIKATLSNRNAFLAEAGIMLFNNLVFTGLWWIFFRQFKEIDGWQFSDMLALIAIGLGSVGVTMVAFGGTRILGKIITNGDLDVFMTLPKSVLLQVAGSRSQAKGWGNLMTSAFMIFMGDFTSFTSILLIFLGIICGSLVFTSFTIIMHSLTFWFGAVEGVAKKYCDSLYLFSNYPTNIYSGLLQIMMFTLIPAGIITYLPVQLIKEFCFIKLTLLLAATAGFVSFAGFVFFSGLKRYESGNLFTFK